MTGRLGSNQFGFVTFYLVPWDPSPSSHHLREYIFVFTFSKHQTSKSKWQNEDFIRDEVSKVVMSSGQGDWNPVFLGEKT